LKHHVEILFKILDFRALTGMQNIFKSQCVYSEHRTDLFHDPGIIGAINIDPEYLELLFKLNALMNIRDGFRDLLPFIIPYNRDNVFVNPLIANIGKGSCRLTERFLPASEYFFGRMQPVKAPLCTGFRFLFSFHRNNIFSG